MSSEAQEQISEDPLQVILCRLQQITGADMVLFGDVHTAPVLRIQTLCSRLDQTWQPHFSYLLATHPCHRVIESRQFQQWQTTADQFPEAYLLHDNRLTAYAGLPISLDSGQAMGILVAMSRNPWKNPALLESQLVAFVAEFKQHHDTVLNSIERARLRRKLTIREQFFREYVLDNPTGVSFSEFMPPLPIDLPVEQRAHRIMTTSFVMECNRTLARMYGYLDISELIGLNPIEVHGSEKATRLADYWLRHNYDMRDVESQSIDAEGNVTWFSGSAFGKLVDGKIFHVWTKRRDLTAQKRYEAAIQHKAHHDALTGLPNRYWFQERVETLTKDHAERGKRLCVGLLDLNGFKEINDTLGHAVGDQILRAVAVRLLKGLNLHGAEMARLGGDEFAIIMPEISDPIHAEAMGHTLQKLLNEPFEVEDMLLSIGGSLGLALFPDWQETGEDLMRLADVAMYAAKKDGLPMRWYHPEIDNHSKRRLSLLTSLGQAIEQGDLFLVYQPKIDVWNGHHSGFEALVRWRHPVHGLIPPNDFIPFAETNEVIRPLTHWVLNEAIRQGAEWLAIGNRLKMAVNVSVRNLLDENLESYILECLKKHAFPADLLELEVTESALMTRPAQAMSMLQSLRSMGVSIAIDDFGTGYSSLAYLARLPVTTLKVDQAFVKDMVRSKSEEQIVRSIIGLAHQCQLTVVAEGVEDEATLLALLNMGCDLAQGYFIARPLEVEQAGKWAANQKASPTAFSYLVEQERKRIVRLG
ncbi:MAG: putative bifunctional diguanylate cyclase/phosphodiesterase [Burkholderiaceae bacterium]